MRLTAWMFIAGVLATMVATALVAMLAFYGVRQLSLQAGLSGLELASSADGPRFQATPVPTLASGGQRAGEAPAATALPAVLPPALADPRARNILLLGVDQRSGIIDDGRFFRTDTMIVIRVEPLRESLAMLSIPRDLWLPFADGGPPARINTANSRGDSQGYPTGGPGLAADTLQTTLGLRIDNYLLVNFDAFLRAVDLLAPNGVEVCIPQRIDDPDYPDDNYGTIQVSFRRGCQQLDAERLLQYARTRATRGADFDRARRQQQVLVAMLRHVASLQGVSRLLSQAPALWRELGDSFRTDLSLDEILQLGLLLRDIPSDNLRQGVIDNQVVRFGTTAGGDKVLFPDVAAIRELIQEVFGNG